MWHATNPSSDWFKFKFLLQVTYLGEKRCTEVVIVEYNKQIGKLGINNGRCKGHVHHVELV
jgi:hypothetical protein